MKMKRLIAAFLAVATMATISACGKKDDTEAVDNGQQVVDVTATPDAEQENIEDEVPDGTPEEKKPDAAKPTKKPTAHTDELPITKPTEKPTQAPTEKPQQKLSVGNTLLADFKSKASSDKSATALAEAVASNAIIEFSAMTMPVEPGLLSGFGNAEITGFSEGAMFGPVIGSIPFIGYVFTLSEGVNAPDFIKTLKDNADLRWNICVEADEMVVGSAGNKVFFVMCPKEFAEE